MVQSRAAGSRGRSLERCYNVDGTPKATYSVLWKPICRNAYVEAGRVYRVQFSPDLAVRFEFSVRDPIHVGHHGISKHPVRHISWTCVPSPHPCLVPAHTLHTPFTPATAQGRDRHSHIIRRMHTKYLEARLAFPFTLCGSAACAALPFEHPSHTRPIDTCVILCFHTSDRSDLHYIFRYIVDISGRLLIDP